MNPQTIIAILTITLPIFGAGVGYLIKQNIEKKKEMTNEVTKESREIYQQYVNLMIGLFAHSKSNKKTSTDQMLTELYTFYKKYVLYASPKVIKAFSDYFQLMYNQNEREKMDTKLHLQSMIKIMAENEKGPRIKK